MIFVNKNGPIFRGVFLGKRKAKSNSENKKTMLEEKKKIIEEIYERRKEYSKTDEIRRKY